MHGSFVMSSTRSSINVFSSSGIIVYKIKKNVFMLLVSLQTYARRVGGKKARMLFL